MMYEQYILCTTKYKFNSIFNIFYFRQEPPRPTYAATAPAIEKNPITGVNEPYFPKNLRLPRLFIGMTIIVIMVCLRYLMVL